MLCQLTVTKLLLIGLCQDGEIRIVNEASGNVDEEQQKSEGSADFVLDPNLSTNETSVEGRVEICYQNVWGAIFDESFTNKDAAVICHELGYSRYGRDIPISFSTTSYIYSVYHNI